MCVFNKSMSMSGGAKRQKQTSTEWHHFILKDHLPRRDVILGLQFIQFTEVRAHATGASSLSNVINAIASSVRHGRRSFYYQRNFEKPSLAAGYGRHQYTW